MELSSQNKLVIKGSIRILDSAKILQAEAKNINDGFTHQLNCIIQEIQRGHAGSVPAVAPKILPRKERARQSFKRKKGQRPLARKERYQSIEEIEIEILKETPGKKQWFKKLYRSIMRKTHPDVLSQKMPIDEKEKFISLSRTAIAAYNSNDEIGLIVIGASLDLYADLPFEEQKAMIIEEHNKITVEVQKIQKSVPWIWGFGCKDINDKIIVLKNLCQQKNLPPIDDDKMEEIIKKHIK